ncbi:uncharacterized protein BCR38DRAFT_446603 [Pseudomassariella vexata]|uniref:Uncharacterized protein n=1 Tax=Pseudomassariella vexata TaxID=1141098 RepID=A0A1Y2DHU2_9PEZI|nr:uncharacterized protein BCR38DRAFT_446603 [Pseudomassariella vexata]ORY58800.1 hypothetical protein BCR38DRAFT_446603 [Pseudomassariella vexata]
MPDRGILAEYHVFVAASIIAVLAYMAQDEACTLPAARLTLWMALNGDLPTREPR